MNGLRSIDRKHFKDLHSLCTADCEAIDAGAFVNNAEPLSAQCRNVQENIGSGAPLWHEESITFCWVEPFYPPLYLDDPGRTGSRKAAQLIGVLADRSRIFLLQSSLPKTAPLGRENSLATQNFEPRPCRLLSGYHWPATAKAEREESRWIKPRNFRCVPEIPLWLRNGKNA